MNTLSREYIEKIYAGWLAKVIGVRLGAPVEGWTYERILDIFGELENYPCNFKQFAADDDTNGPLFFLRALEDSRNGFEITPQDVGEALLNYACFEQGFFWWGGYGKSTEHTAYLNLRSGIQAPQSGSIALNGEAVAEQIGGQIFIDSWGLVTPGNPDLAAKYAKIAASVTHDGNGIYGGIFVAVCISYAFIEKDIRKIIEKGLSYIPEDCEYTRVVRAVMEFYEKQPKNWRSCFAYIKENFGYDKYPGNCHIIPNSAVMILALLYGEGDFSDTLNICNMCGWDTDCNVGNIATIMGVREGLSAIDGDRWRKPINDILICSSVLGSMNILDIPECADWIVTLAAKLSGKELPEPWKQITEKKKRGCHFEYPGSTHGMRARFEHGGSLKAYFRNTVVDSADGKRCLQFTTSGRTKDRTLLYKKTYYQPGDFDDSRYDPSFSPILYGGQTIEGKLRLNAGGNGCYVCAYAHQIGGEQEMILGPWTELTAEEWQTVSVTLPSTEGGIFDEAGFAFHQNGSTSPTGFSVYLDEFYFGGAVEHTIDFSKNWLEVWSNLRKEVSGFTKMKGITYLEDGKLHLSCSDFGETYTGDHLWEDYQAEFLLTPECGECHMGNVRVQGAIRSYGVGFGKSGKLGFYKNANGYQALEEVDFSWEPGKEYRISVSCRKNHFSVFLNDIKMIETEDIDHPYLRGAVGLSVQKGSHLSCQKISVKSI